MPALHDWRRNATLTFAAMPLSLWAERSYQAMPRRSHLTMRGPLPMLWIIVPARNQACNLCISFLRCKSCVTLARWR